MATRTDRESPGGGIEFSLLDRYPRDAVWRSWGLLLCETVSQTFVYRRQIFINEEMQWGELFFAHVCRRSRFLWKLIHGS